MIDENLRVAHAEIHDNGKTITAIEVSKRAVAWFADRNVGVERAVSDNCCAYRFQAWRNAGTQRRIQSKRTFPYQPQPNLRIERFHRTLDDVGAYAQSYKREKAPRSALPA